ncbi:MAG: hypothetical protein P8189_00420 [Anaerolineae bacterium]
MKRIAWIVGGFALLALLLVSGAYMVGRLLGQGVGNPGAGDDAKVGIGSSNGEITEVDFVKAEELPEEPPDVVGVYARRQDNSIFVDETDGGFVLAPNDDGTLSVANATGKISEIVVTAETIVNVDLTLEHLDEAVAEGVLRQQLEPGTIEEIGELSFVRAWGEMRGDRLVAGLLVYNRPPVISR